MFIDKLILSEVEEVLPIWEAVVNKLTMPELEKRLQQLINLINRPDTDQDIKCFACQLLEKMGGRLNSDQCNRAETALRGLGDEDDNQTRLIAIRAGCQFYINAGLLNEVSIDLILCTIKYERVLLLGQRLNNFTSLILQLSQIIPQLTPRCLAMLTQAGAEIPLNRSGPYQAVLFTAHQAHRQLQALPQLGGGGGGGGGKP